MLIKQIIRQKKINQENIARLAKIKQTAEELEKKLKEEHKIEDTTGFAESAFSNGAKSKSKSQVKRKKLKSAAGNRRGNLAKGSRIILNSSKKQFMGDVQGEITNMKTASDFYKPGGNRAFSANVVGNPKLRRYEQAIKRIKKMIGNECRKLRDIRTRYAKEIESKTQLEQLLRQCVDDVKAEISRKRSENKVLYYTNKRTSSSMSKTRKNDLTQNEREKVIEVLLSQERVLTLLYDKTFPPKLAENNQIN